MKIALVGPAYPLRGGIAHFNESLALAFIKNNIDAKIISFYYQYPSFLFPGKTQISKREKPDNLIIKPLISSINPVSWIKTAKYLKRESPDIIIIQFWLPYMSPSLGSIARIIKNKNKCKILAIIHNVFPHEKSLIDRILIKYFINSCDYFLCLSNSVLQQLQLFNKDKKTITIPHPIYDIFGEKISKQEARSFLGLNENDKIILFFGIIRKYKGLNLLLEALSYENIKNLNLKLIVAGEFYEDKTQYIKKVNDLNITENVIFIDKYIPDNEVKYYFCAADLIVQPYISATQSGVTQIAYNFDKPIIVTNVGSLAEFVINNKTGYVVSTDPIKIAQAIEDYFMNNRDEEMSENIKKEKYRFTWNYMVESILDLIK